MKARGGQPPSLAAAEQAETLALAIRGSRVGLWSWDLETDEVYLSPEWKALLGYGPDELEDTLEDFSSRVHPEDLERIEGSHPGFLQAPVLPHDLELRLRHRDGSYRWFLSRGEPQGGREDRPTRLVGCLLDISDRKAAEQAAAERLEILETIFDRVPVMIAFVAGDGRILTANQLWVEALGWSLSELQRHPDPFAAWYPDPEDRARVMRLLGAGTGEFVDLGTTARDGRVIDTSFAHVKPSDGTSIVIGLDVTERRAMEDRLRQSEALYRTIAEASPVGILLYDQRGEVSQVNAAMGRLAGLPPAELCGRGWLAALHPEDGDRVEAEWTRAAGRGQPYQGEGRFRRPGGSVVWWRLTSAPVTVGEGSAGFVAVVEDLTAERARAAGLEEQVDSRTQDLAERVAEVELLNRGMLNLMEDLEASHRRLEVAHSELEAYSYSVSHDLKAPLRAIRGFSEILKEGLVDQLSEEHDRYLEYVVEASGQMERLIDDLLAYSRLGRKRVRRDRVELADVVRSVVAGRAADSVPAARIMVEPNLPPVLGDETLVRQIVSNLVTNAVVYYREASGPVVEIESRPDDEWVVLVVRDEGIGIAPENQTKIFQIFQRLHPDSDYPGTGIGLAIVKKAVELLGGRIHLHSEPNRGSEFEVFLPKVPE